MGNLFQQKQQIDNSDETTEKLPERALWTAGLARACLDAFKGPPRLDMTLKTARSHMNHANYDKDAAIYFLMNGGDHFKQICEMAGRNPADVQEKARKLLLRKNGWNIDVPITSHYRSRKRGEKRGPYKKKKHLTGNSYYAAKAKKNFYYQDMGRKGGRPRMYNKIEVPKS